MKKIFFFMFSIMMLLSAGDVYTPQKGSIERAAIMDALRAEVKRTQGIDVVFVVHTLKLKDGWAWTITAPMSKDGSDHYEDIIALLHEQEHAWQIKELVCTEIEASGCTDDPDFFEGLMQRFPNVPKEILTFEGER